jgi:hypothetical protein
MIKPFIAFTLIAAALHLSPTATGAEAESADAEVTNMLIFGNSACHGLIEHLPRMYAADGQKLRVRCLRAHAGGFTHAVEAIESGQATGDPLPKEMPDGKSRFDYGYVALETDYDARVFLLDEIRARDWDVVVLVSNTGLAATEAKFDFFRKTAAFARKHRPDARIVMYQNFAVRNDSQSWLVRAEEALQETGLLGEDEVLTEDAFCWFSSHNYTRTAEQIEAALVPAGDILYWIRHDPRWGYRAFPNHVQAKERYAALEYPETPDQDRCLRRGFHWKPNHEEWGVDHHLNARGNYVVAAAAYEVLLDKDIRENRFKPEGISPAEARLLGELIHEVLADKARIPLCENVARP